MTSTVTSTYSVADIRRVFASFAADYRIVAEFTGLHESTFVASTIGQIQWLAQEEYLSEVHIQLKSSTGVIRRAATYKVSTTASAWSSDRPGNLYWPNSPGDSLTIVVFFSNKWHQLPTQTRINLENEHLPNWSSTNFDGSYANLSGSVDKTFSSRAYGLERKVFS